VKLRASLCLGVLVVLVSPHVAIASAVQDAIQDQGSSCAPENTDAQGEQSLRASRPAKLPFRLSSGYLIEVNGRIGDQGNLKFLLDTGATISILDSRVANQFSLHRRPAESFSFDRKLRWDRATIPEVQFGQVRACNVEMLVGQLGRYSAFAKHLDAVIGTDLLKLTDFSIDYDTNTIVFLAGQREYTPPAEPLSACIVLELVVQDHPLRLIVDTGFQGLLLYRERLQEQIPMLRTVGNSTAVTVGASLAAIQVELPDVAFGTRTDVVTALLVKGPPPDTLPDMVGVVGLTPLKARRVRFDFGNKKLTWE
jgi:predicted aspartyl protease